MDCRGKKWGDVVISTECPNLAEFHESSGKIRQNSSHSVIRQLRMFIGEYSHSVDEKGRLALPVKFRTAFSSGCVVTRGIDQCLAVYTAEEWKTLAAKLSALPLAQANSRAFSRLMLAGAMDLEPDKQGRIVLPDYLREYGRLGKSVVLAGLYNRVEIWDKEAWNAYTQRTEAASQDIAEKLGELGV